MATFHKRLLIAVGGLGAAWLVLATWNPTQQQSSLTPLQVQREHESPPSTNGLPSALDDNPGDRHPAESVAAVVPFARGDSARNHALRFVTPANVPLPGVLLFDTNLASGGKLVGKSDSDGVIRVAPSMNSAELRAKATGFADEKIKLGEICCQEMDVVLSAAGVISGRVVDGLGKPLAGMTVVAWPRNTSARLIRRAVCGDDNDPCSFVCESDMVGRFMFDRLMPGQVYSVVAGGRAHAVELTRSDCPASDLELVARPVFWGSLHVVDDSNRPIRIDPRLEISVETNISVITIPTARSIGVGASAVLAGIPKEFVGSEYCTTRWAFVCDEDRTTLPVQCEIKLPGYEEQTIILELPRISAEVPSFEAKLKNSGAGQGQLTLVFVRDFPPSSPLVPPQGTLILEPSTKGHLAFTIGSDAEQPFVFDVPRDTYSCRFKSIAGDFMCPARHLPPETVVVDSTPVAFVVHYPATGSLEVRVTSMSMWTTSLRCALASRMVEGVNGLPRLLQGKSLSIAGPPFLLEGLVPGLYSIALQGPPARLDGVHEFLITADQRTVLKIDLN